MLSTLLFAICLASASPSSFPVVSGAQGDVPVLAPHAPIQFGDDAANAWAQPFFPDATYDPKVAVPEELFGAPLGSRIASHSEVLAMLRAIAATSDRARMVPYGQTFEGRPLMVCMLTSPANHARLAEIQAAAKAMSDPRGGGDIDAIVLNQPAIAWMGYGIHGDETSATEAAVPFAYHLAASMDPDVAKVMDEVVVLLDPCLNPDGRERIRSMVVQSAGYRANLDNGSMQRGRWPGGRGNHFLFDMNRDWMAGEAPETRARWVILQEYPPQLFVDAHEMSGLDTFLFYPQAAPRNEHLPERLDHWQKVLAAGAAKVFDGYGWGYYTREWADALYPGYSDAWGSLTGAIGMLYEQGRTIGAPLERESGEIVSYRETVHGQVAASMANVLTFAENRVPILQDYVAHRRKAVAEETRLADRMFAVRPSGDIDRDARFLRTMIGQGIEVRRATAEFTAASSWQALGGASAGAVAFPAGTWLISASQPQGAMVRTYLEFDPELTQAFLEKERASIERGEGSKIYDVTGWNLGHQMGLDCAWIPAATVLTEKQGYLTAPAGPVGDISGAYAWVADGEDGRSLRFAALAMESGLELHVSDKDFGVSVRGDDGAPMERSFLRGSFLIRRHENRDGMEERILDAARRSNARVYAVLSGRAPGDGPDLGGGHFGLLEAPKVAILSNTPVSPADFGHVWSYVDQELGLPATLVDAQSFGDVDLRRYNVLIAPPGAGSVLKGESAALETWVRAGGTLVAIGSSAFAVANEKLPYSSNRLRRDVLEDLDDYAWPAQRQRDSRDVTVDRSSVYGPAEPAVEASGTEPEESTPDDEEGGKDPASPEASEDPEEKPEDLDRWRRGFSPAGVILRAEFDARSWITSGIPSEARAVPFAGSRVLMSEGRPAVRLADAAALRLSGLLWPEARARIADSAWLTVEDLGRGQVISFAASPVFRGSWRGTARLLGNAVVLGPGMVR